MKLKTLHITYYNACSVSEHWIKNLINVPVLYLLLSITLRLLDRQCWKKYFRFLLTKLLLSVSVRRLYHGGRWQSAGGCVVCCGGCAGVRSLCTSAWWIYTAVEYSIRTHNDKSHNENGVWANMLHNNKLWINDCKYPPPDGAAHTGSHQKVSHRTDENLNNRFTSNPIKGKNPSPWEIGE